MKLNKLITCSYETEITGIKIDSREVEKGDLFIAVKGFNIDHNLYIDDAIKKGAVAVISERNWQKSVPVIKVDNIEEALVEICKKFYSYNNNIRLIGITGTDGKTTTATILEELLTLKEKTSYIGTNGIKTENGYQSTENTTPSVDKMYKYLSELYKNKYKNVVLEVSSEALLHKRVDSFKFKYAIYTNITEDHLNIHKSVENYIKAKNHLIDLVEEDGYVIINADDKNCNKLDTKGKKVITYGKNHKCDYIIDYINEKEDTTEFILKHKDTTYKFESPLKGEYNVYNLTASIIVCFLENIELQAIKEKVRKIDNIPGRREYLNFGQEYTLVLDYAHTENGIRTIVESFKNKGKPIFVVTGQAGGREVEKREKIGSYLLNNVDEVIFTMDDPRHENVNDIIDQMIGKEKSNNYKRIVDRRKAIKYALQKAKQDDIVLVLGKGRDKYMAVEDRREPYCDYDVIKEFFGKNTKK